MAEKNPNNFTMGGPGCKVCRKAQEKAALKRQEELSDKMEEAIKSPLDWNQHPNRK